jgi:hypothetical protein
MADRRYDEQQIGAILQRAAEIQSGLSPAADAQGLTLSELQKVASEVGIEPHLVERAAREVETGPIGTKDIGQTLAGMLDRTVAGEITDEQWEDVVMALRQFVGRPGATTVQGNTREWSGGWDIGSVTLTASTRNGQTRFRMLTDTSGGSALAWVAGSVLGFLSMLFVGVAIGKNGLGPVATSVGVGLTAVLFGLSSHFIGRRVQRKLNRRVVEIFQSVIASVSRSQPSISTTVEPIPEVEVQRLVAE